jgi:hypothetical protein
VNKEESRLRCGSAKHAHHIVQHGTRTRGDNRNPLWGNWDWTLARRIEETFTLQLATECLHFLREQSDPARAYQRVRDHLISTAWRIEVDPAEQDHHLANRWELLTRSNAATEADRIER